MQFSTSFRLNDFNLHVRLDGLLTLWWHKHKLKLIQHVISYLRLTFTFRSCVQKSKDKFSLPMNLSQPKEQWSGLFCAVLNMKNLSSLLQSKFIRRFRSRYNRMNEINRKELFGQWQVYDKTIVDWNNIWACLKFPWDAMASSTLISNVYQAKSHHSRRGQLLLLAFTFFDGIKYLWEKSNTNLENGLSH